jgi:hypothetical protein
MGDLFSEKIERFGTVADGYATEGGVGIITVVCYIAIGAIAVEATITVSE